MPLMSAISWAAGPTSMPVIPKTFHSPGNPPGGGGGGGNYGYGSTYFDGTGDYLETPSSLDFTMGTGDFTVECWFKPAFDTSVDNTYHAYMWEIGNQRVYITIDDGTLYLANAFIGAIANVSIGNIQGEWHHVAVTKQSNTYKLWYDGQLQGSGSDSNEITGPTGNESLIFRIANHTYWGSTNYEFNGHISNMRVIKGTAFYTSNFTVPTTPLAKVTNTVLLTCQDTTGTITDNSDSNHTMTVFGDTVATTNSPFVDPNYTPRGSTYFDGSGDYLTIANSQNFYNLGTADWTIEFWAYFTDVSVFNGVFQLGEDVGALSAMLYTDGKLKLLENDQALVFESNTTFQANKWYHCAFTNDDSSNTQRLWVNGIAQTNTGSKSTAYSYGNKTIYIGGRYFSGSFQRDMNGYLSNFRIVSANLYPIASGGGSAYFDGTDDLLKVANNTSFRLGTGDFTIECWVYFDDTSLESGSNRRIFNLHETGNAVDNLQIVIDDGGYRKAGDLFLYSNSIQGYLDTDIRGGWHHIAVNRASGTLKFYLDGVEKYSATNTQDYSPGGASGPRPVIGSRGDDKGDYNGYISNFRMVVGSSLYSAGSGASTYFDGSGDYIDTTNPLSGTGDFTMEGWIYHTTSGSFDGYFSTCLDTGANGGIVVGIDKFFVTHGGGSSQIGWTGGAIGSNSVWYHICLQRISNVFYLYKDGVLQGSATATVNLTGSTIRLGSRYSNNTTYMLTGYISNFRIVTGSAVYDSGGFTPPTSPLTAISGTQLLTCQNSTGSITDASSNGYTITANGNAVANVFDPFSSSNYNFTVPTVPLTDVTNTQLLTCQNYTGSITDESSNAHVISETGGVNATYSSPFVESTAPLSAISNTQLLTCQNSTGAITDASSNGYTITTNGDAQASGLHPFNANGSTDGSYYFSSLNAWNGTNARVITADSNDFNLPDGTDVTVEFWYKIPVTPPTAGNGYLFDLGDGNYGWLAAYAWNQNGTHTLRVGTYFGAIWLADEDLVGMVQNQWYHLAITRESGIWKVYLDGVFQGSKANSALGSFDTWPDRISLGGYHNMSYPNYGVVSYISDFRFVKGLAVYTGNFSPPSGPLTTTGGTYPSTANITNPTSAQTLLLTAQNSSGSFVDNSQYSRSLTSYNTVTTEAGVPY